MIDKSIDILNEDIGFSIKKGADYADIFVQSGVAHSAYYEDGRIEEISSSITDGSGARIIIGDKTYYSHAPGTLLKNVRQTLENAMYSADMAPTLVSADRELDLIPRGDEAIAPPDLDFLRKLDLFVRKQSKFVRQAAFRHSMSRRKILIIKPDGTIVDEIRNYCSFAVQVVTEKDGALQTGFERRCMTVPYESFWNGCVPENIAQAALERALLMLDAKPCPAGKMNVLLAGEAGGTIVHEACGHGLEADIVEKDYSVYKGKIGEKVAGDMVTMVDDPTIPGLYGSYKYDDEGTPSARSILIENGILKRYMTDILSAKTWGFPLTGNGRRESYRNIPVPRMSNTFIIPGDSDFDDMIEQTGNGLLVKKMGGGEVNPTSGDFVFYVSEAFIIKKGKVKEAVKGAILTGNGPNALQNITALGRSLVMDPGFCGKSGQGVPVTDGQPSMLIEGLTVGGSET